MKKNYFTIHKNKKPKRLYKSLKSLNPFSIMPPIIAAIGAFQINTLLSKPIIKYDKDKGFNITPDEIVRQSLLSAKKDEIIKCAYDTSNAIFECLRKANRFEFERTGKYKRINKP